MSLRASRRGWPWVWAVGLLLVQAVPALAQAAGAPVHAARSGSPYEPGLMLLVVTAIFVTGGVVFRILARLRIVGRLVWMVPILVVITGIAWAGLQFAGLKGYDDLRTLIGFMLSFLLLLSVLYPITRLILPSRALLTRAGVPPLLRGLAIAILAFVGMFVLLNWSFPNLSLTPMFVTSGVVSIVLGLALQDLLGNLMAGIVMSMERPFKVGDWVRIGETEGEVVGMTWRITRVRTRENDYVLLPNNLVARTEVVNYDQPTSEHMLKIYVGVTYDTPCALAVQALIEAATSVEEVLARPAPDAHFRDFGDSSLVYELRVWIDNYTSLPAIESDVRKQIWYAFKRYGITIPFPQRDVNFKRVVAEPAELRARLLVTGGPLRGAMFPLGDSTTTIGRSLESDIYVSDAHVSTHHAVIDPHKGGYRLRDLESRHGTRVNGRLIEHADLQQGDEICIGPVTLMYETNPAPVNTIIEKRMAPRGAENVEPVDRPRSDDETIA